MDDAYAVIEDNGDSQALDSAKDKSYSSLEKGLSLVTRAGQAIVLSQKGKKDTVNFTLQVRRKKERYLSLQAFEYTLPLLLSLQVMQRRILRSDRLSVARAQLDMLGKAFYEQKV